MIVVDTNVLSETLSHSPDANVLTWLGANTWDIAISTVTVAETLFGAQRLPAGRRKNHPSTSIERLMRSAAGRGRLLPYDEAAARAHAGVRVAREAVGRAASVSTW